MKSRVQPNTKQTHFLILGCCAGRCVVEYIYIKYFIPKEEKNSPDVVDGLNLPL